MSGLGRATRAAVLLRSLVIQGSWNYRTLIGTGFAFALLPALRRVYRESPERLAEALERHRGVFNSHPYLVPMALGAVARLEETGEDSVLIERFKTAVRGSLGTLGDRLVWAGWRPLCSLVALALLLLGLPWWAVIAAFLGVYNAGHVWVRIWSYRVGLEEMTRVGERLRRSPIPQVQEGLMVAGAFFVGVVLPPAAAGWVAGRPLPLPWVAACLVMGGVGIWLGARLRTPLVLALAALALFGILLGVV